MSEHLPNIAIFGLKGFPARGGTASVGENLVKELNTKYSFTVYATSSHANNKKPYKNVKAFILKKFLPHKLNIFYYNLISAIHAVLFGNYDLVHTNQIDTAYIVPILRLRYRVVSTHHGRTYKMSKWGNSMKFFFKQTEKLMLKCANAVTFVSEFEMCSATPKYSHKYSTVNNGINLHEEVKDLSIKEDYILFAAGRIIPHKGCHDFLEALVRINYQGKVKIIGDYLQVKSYSEKLLSYQEKLNIDFVGMLKDKSELLAYVNHAKLFVFPSYYEAMSIMLLEVVSMKTPLICSDIQQNTSVFEEDEVEYYRVGEVDELSGKIVKFLDNPSVFDIKVQRAYLKLQNKLSWTNIAKQYDIIYQSLL